MKRTKEIEPTLRTAIVTSVYSEQGLTKLDAAGFRVQSNYNAVMVPSRFKYEGRAPEEEDKVTLQRTDQNYWILRDVLTQDTEVLDDVELKEDEYILRPDDNTEVRLKPTESGSYKVTVKASGNLEEVSQADINVSAKGEVNISADGNITVSTPNGDVVIDEGGTAKKVATEDHTHDYSGSTSDGATYSGTTTKPDDVTEVEIE